MGIAYYIYSMPISLARMQLLTICNMKAICLFSFFSHSHQLVFFFPFPFPLPLSLQMVWLEKEKRAVPVVIVQWRQREETHTAKGVEIIRGIYSRGTTQRCRYSPGMWVWRMGVKNSHR